MMKSILTYKKTFFFVFKLKKNAKKFKNSKIKINKKIYKSELIGEIT